MKSKIINVQTNEIKEIDQTAEDIAKLEKELSEFNSKQTEMKTIETKKEADAKAGNDKLLALGLTQDEVTAMTGYKIPVENVSN